MTNTSNKCCKVNPTIVLAEKNKKNKAKQKQKKKTQKQKKLYEQRPKDGLHKKIQK